MTIFFLFLFSAFIGLLYPCVDKRLGEKPLYKREWSHVMRCLAVFVGINHASAVSFLVCLFVFTLTGTCTIYNFLPPPQKKVVLLDLAQMPTPIVYPI